MGQVKYWLEVSPNAYGFGNDYILCIKTEDAFKRFWLGQDAKVFRRILDIDIRYAVEYYSRKAGSRNFEKVQKLIARDIIKAFLGLAEDEHLTDSKIRRLLDAESWELSV